MEVTTRGMNLVSVEMDNFYWKWGVSIRLTPVRYPQSYGQMQASAAKRVNRDNIDGEGRRDMYKAWLALLHYLNTPSMESARHLLNIQTALPG